MSWTILKTLPNISKKKSHKFSVAILDWIMWREIRQFGRLDGESRGATLRNFGSANLAQSSESPTFPLSTLRTRQRNVGESGYGAYKILSDSLNFCQSTTPASGQNVGQAMNFCQQTICMIFLTNCWSSEGGRSILLRFSPVSLAPPWDIYRWPAEFNYWVYSQPLNC